MGISLFIVAVLLIHAQSMPRLRKVKAAYKSSDWVVVDRNGLVIDEIHRGENLRRLGWVDHTGIAPEFEQIVRDSSSTPLSLRLIRLLEPDESPLSHAIRAALLEAGWRDHQIFEAYVNLSRYRNGLQGLRAASLGLFDKAPIDLEKPEIAVLAAMLEQPAASMNVISREACKILSDSDEPESCVLLSQSHLSYVENSYNLRPYTRMAPQVALHLAKLANQADGGLVRSTLDRGLQWEVIRALQKQTADSAALILDNTSGEILAYVSQTGTRRMMDDSVQTKHKVGPILRPLIFARAVDERVLTSDTSLQGGAPDLRSALSGNFVTPAMHVLELLGDDAFIHQVAGPVGPSQAVGSAEASLLDISNAYRVLGNGGMWSPAKFSQDEALTETARRVMAPGAAFIVAEIMGRSHQGLGDPYWAAMSTGTNGEGSSWAVGFSEKYTVGVWTADLSADSAAGAWQAIMDSLHRRTPSQQPLPPPDVRRRKWQWYLSGTEEKNRTISHIAFPQDGSVIDLQSPDRRLQHLYIQIEAPQQDQNIYLNGQRLGRAQARLPWAAQSGMYTLELRDPRGQVVDRVVFEVRGRTFALTE